MKNMYPNCKIELVNNCCIRCGYLSNGNKINNVPFDKNQDIRLLNENYDIMLHNDNWYVPLILGPLYLSYRKHVFIGTICLFLDIGLFIFLGMFSSGIFYFSFITNITMFLYVIISRIIYAAFSNIICLKLETKKINKIKNKYPDEYKNKIKINSSIVYTMLSILIFVLVIAILVINRRIENGTLVL